ncbi:MAG: SIMPL domain-containing protein [Anaerolineae bacterium]|nr:SIMPL domain-containing protein [Anaerolineae bacterium]MCI0609109.1 SIMPL domain-containing protein [Anaerolineae bacterium]
MESKPDTIKVSANYREEIYANHANLFVTVKGSSLISGNEAMQKAKEVNQLVEALTGFGLSPDAVHLQGVRIETASGALLKSSSAIYHLKIRCEKLDQLAALLDIIASQKNATLERIEWKYPEESAREHGLEAAIAQAKGKANKVAAALGVKLLGVYDFIENAYDEERPVPMPMQAMMMKSRAEMADAPSLEMDIQHSKTIHVNLEVWYRVSEFGNT